MNRLKASVKTIRNIHELTLLSLVIESGEELEVLMLDSSSLKGLALGVKLTLLFKETEVILATLTSKLATRNAHPAQVVGIERGELLARVRFRVGKETLAALLTLGALESLEIREGEVLLWCVKENEITLKMDS